MKAKTLWHLLTDHRCHLCLQEIDRPGLATIDHLVPRAKGGREGWPNVGLAHKTCNRDRGHTDLPFARLIEIVQARLGTTRHTDIIATLYRPISVKCNEFVVESRTDLFYLCTDQASHAVKYNEIEGWVPKCEKHVKYAKACGADIKPWALVPRDLQAMIKDSPVTA